MYTNIVWDFDGTLFDTYPAIADVFVEVLLADGISENRAEILKYLHISLGETYSHFSKKHSIDMWEFREKFIIAEEAMDTSASPPFPNASELLEKVIEKGGKNLIYTNRGNSIYSFLDYFGYNHYFEEIITREDGLGRKPEPDCLIYFMEKYDMDPKSMLMVGDRELDILSAKNAGIASCYFNSHKIPIDTASEIYIENLIELDPYI
jgi:HAD superfamily hydrolase (TIGR01549 family)